VKAMVWHGPEQLSVDEVPDVEAAPGEVVLAPEAVGICGSEVEGHKVLGGARVPPLVMGHEIAGRVVAVGEGVDAAWEGWRAAINPLLPGPGARPGRENISPTRRLIGIHRPGGFAAAMPVPVEALHAVPDETDPRVAALAEPFANGLHVVGLGLDGAPPETVERAVVLGAGALGVLVLRAALLAGLPSVAVVEPHTERRERALRLGAHAAFASVEEAGREEADLTMDAVGADATRQGALTLLRSGGRAVLLGLADDVSPIAFHDVVRRELAIIGSYAYTPAEYERALDWLVSGRAALDELAAVRPLDEGPAAFAELVRGPGSDIRVFLAAEPQA
jgi:2-desacetyl-2-hydroxyethyl bacteriochlorophyllide A dehydrogenase